MLGDFDEPIPQYSCPFTSDENMEAELEAEDTPGVLPEKLPPEIGIQRMTERLAYLDRELADLRKRHLALGKPSQSLSSLLHITHRRRADAARQLSEYRQLGLVRN